MRAEQTAELRRASEKHQVHVQQTFSYLFRATASRKICIWKAKPSLSATVNTPEDMYTFVKPQIGFQIRLNCVKPQWCQAEGLAYQLISAAPDLAAQQGREQINDSWRPLQPLSIHPLTCESWANLRLAVRLMWTTGTGSSRLISPHLASSLHPYSFDFVMCEAAKKETVEDQCVHVSLN